MPLRVVVTAKPSIFAGHLGCAALEVRELGELTIGMIGLWCGNDSDGDFRNLRLTPAK